MYPHVTQFQTSGARARDRARLDAERRAGSRAHPAVLRAQVFRSRSVRAILAAFSRAG
jgi:hypothetical protein